MLDPVTNRYAEALFALAGKQGQLDAVRADVTRLAGELSREAVASFLFDARVSVDTRREKIAPLTDGMNPLTRNFVALLFDKRREEVLRGLGAAFKRMDLRARGASEGVVQSARPLGPNELASLARTVGARLGRDVSLTNEVDPSLVGGVRVLVDNKMIDASVRGRVDGLRKRMIDAPLPA